MNFKFDSQVLNSTNTVIQNHGLWFKLTFTILPKFGITNIIIYNTYYEIIKVMWLMFWLLFIKRTMKRLRSRDWCPEKCKFRPAVVAWFVSTSLSHTGEASSSLLDVRPVITNNPRALGQGLVGVWRLYHFPVVPTQGVIPEEGEYKKKK